MSSAVACFFADGAEEGGDFSSRTKNRRKRNAGRWGGRFESLARDWLRRPGARRASARREKSFFNRRAGACWRGRFRSGGGGKFRRAPAEKASVDVAGKNSIRRSVRDHALWPELFSLQRSGHVAVVSTIHGAGSGDEASGGQAERRWWRGGRRRDHRRTKSADG